VVQSWRVSPVVLLRIIGPVVIARQLKAKPNRLDKLDVQHYGYVLI